MLTRSPGSKSRHGLAGCSCRPRGPPSRPHPPGARWGLNGAPSPRNHHQEGLGAPARSEGSESPFGWLAHSKPLGQVPLHALKHHCVHILFTLRTCCAISGHRGTPAVSVFPLGRWLSKYGIFACCVDSGFVARIFEAEDKVPPSSTGVGTSCLVTRWMEFNCAL